MTLEKLTIKAEQDAVGDFAEEIKVLFNPNEISMTIPGGKMDKYGLTATANLVSLNLNLFFDTTLQSYPPKNVQKEYTSKIVNLTKPRIGQGKKRPPRCQLVWGTISGKDSILLADCFLESVTKRLTHFLEDGTPVRATLDCAFKEWKEPKKKKKIENPVDDPVRIVKQGETLSSIATEEFGDPSLWRIIADENSLVNPLKLTPGDVLTIPPLKAANVTQRM